MSVSSYTSYFTTVHAHTFCIKMYALPVGPIAMSFLKAPEPQRCSPTVACMWRGAAPRSQLHSCGFSTTTGPRFKLKKHIPAKNLDCVCWNWTKFYTCSTYFTYYCIDIYTGSVFSSTQVFFYCADRFCIMHATLCCYGMQFTVCRNRYKTSLGQILFLGKEIFCVQKLLFGGRSFLCIEDIWG